MSKEAEKSVEPVEDSQPTVEPEVVKPKKKARKSRKSKKEARKDTIPVPIYFTDPAFDDEGTLAIQKLEAHHWFLGTGPFEKEGKSFSAKVTYVGPRKFMSRQIVLGKRSINPNKGNWKTFVGSARIRQNIEYHGNIKDTQFVLNALNTQGGLANYKIRFVEDDPLAVKEEKSRFLTRDKSRVLRLPYRLRKDQIKMGVKVPLNPGEAAQILKELSEEGLPKSSKGITEYLNSVIEEEKRLKKKQEEPKAN
jgi:hypothetical protein